MPTPSGEGTSDDLCFVTSSQFTFIHLLPLWSQNHRHHTAAAGVLSMGLAGRASLPAPEDA